MSICYKQKILPLKEVAVVIHVTKKGEISFKHAWLSTKWTVLPQKQVKRLCLDLMHKNNNILTIARSSRYVALQTSGMMKGSPHQLSTLRLWANQGFSTASQAREMAKSVLTKAFLQPAKAAATYVHGTPCWNQPTSPYPTFFVSAKPIFKMDCANWYM